MWWSRRSVSQGLREQHQVRWTHAVNAASTRGSNQAAQLGAEGAGCRAQVVQQLGQDVRPRLLGALQGEGGRGQGGALVRGGQGAEGRGTFARRRECSIWARMCGSAC